MAVKTIYGWVGDSTTEGYGDGATISFRGVPGRLLKLEAATTNTVTILHHNLGASGMMVPHYISIAKGIIDADPRMYTAILCSIWSPNIPNGATPGIWPTDPVNTAAMLAALIDFEAWLLERSIVFIPTFMAGSPFNMNAVTRPRLQTYLNSCIARWPWLLNLNTPVQDPAFTDGPSIAAAYRDDATHVNSTGLALQATYVRPLLPAALATAVAHYGFVEP
jgi:hypothetical protein